MNEKSSNDEQINRRTNSEVEFRLFETLVKQEKENLDKKHHTKVLLESVEQPEATLLPETTSPPDLPP